MTQFLPKTVITELPQHRMNRSSFVGNKPLSSKVKLPTCPICYNAIHPGEKTINTIEGITHDHCGIGIAVTILEKANLPRPTEFSIGRIENYLYQQIKGFDQGLHDEQKLCSIFDVAEFLCIPIKWRVALHPNP
jgi:hypothetical protein